MSAPRVVQTPEDPYSEISPSNPYYPTTGGQIIIYRENPIDEELPSETGDINVARAQQLQKESWLVSCWLMCSLVVTIFYGAASWYLLYGIVFQLMGLYGAKTYNRKCFWWFLAFYMVDICISFMYAGYLTEQHHTDSNWTYPLVLTWVIWAVRVYITRYLVRFYKKFPTEPSMSRV